MFMLFLTVRPTPDEPNIASNRLNSTPRRPRQTQIHQVPLWADRNGKASAEVLLRGGRLTSLDCEFFTRPWLVFLFLFGRFLLCWHVSSVNDFPLQGVQTWGPLIPTMPNF